MAEVLVERAIRGGLPAKSVSNERVQFFGVIERGEEHAFASARLRRHN
jgi:hypothetical protein